MTAKAADVVVPPPPVLVSTAGGGGGGAGGGGGDDGDDNEDERRRLANREKLLSAAESAVAAAELLQSDDEELQWEHNTPAGKLKAKVAADAKAAAIAGGRAGEPFPPLPRGARVPVDVHERILGMAKRTASEDRRLRDKGNSRRLICICMPACMRACMHACMHACLHAGTFT